jgi:hypothetical protein
VGIFRSLAPLGTPTLLRPAPPPARRHLAARGPSPQGARPRAHPPIARRVTLLRPSCRALPWDALPCSHARPGCARRVQHGRSCVRWDAPFLGQRGRKRSLPKNIPNDSTCLPIACHLIFDSALSVPNDSAYLNTSQSPGFDSQVWEHCLVTGVIASPCAHVLRPWSASLGMSGSAVARAWCSGEPGCGMVRTAH